MPEKAHSNELSLKGALGRSSIIISPQAEKNGKQESMPTTIQENASAVKSMIAAWFFIFLLSFSTSLRHPPGLSPHAAPQAAAETPGKAPEH